jgi:hypothetical protein
MVPGYIQGLSRVPPDLREDGAGGSTSNTQHRTGKQKAEMAGKADQSPYQATPRPVDSQPIGPHKPPPCDPHATHKPPQGANKAPTKPP